MVDELLRVIGCSVRVGANETPAGDARRPMKAIQADMEVLTATIMDEAASDRDREVSGSVTPSEWPYALVSFGTGLTLQSSNRCVPELQLLTYSELDGWFSVRRC
jgi:hypothetical protein